mmetsp:Transcript_16369/g.24484  ORF Transcript_16369/g.24484 Transcript_16369/m.24484 type:complete len:273 (+) Transcript_16369:25-843(+)
MLTINLAKNTMKCFKRSAAVIAAFGSSSSHAFTLPPQSSKITQQRNLISISHSTLILDTQKRCASSSSKRRIDQEFSKLNLSSYNDDIDQEMNKLNLSSNPQPGAPSPSPLAFRKGNPILVEVVRFGPLGASVEVVGRSHSENDMIPEEEPALGYGLILQKEIGYFRAGRGGVDVVMGEILPAYVDWVRDDGKVDISLRKPGGKGKAEDLSEMILEKLKESASGEIDVGDKSSPDDINTVFPGSSKASFKRAVAFLFKKGLVKPGPKSTKLM